MFWKDLLPLWQKTCKLPSVWLETLEKHCQKQCFGRISYCGNAFSTESLTLFYMTEASKRQQGWRLSIQDSAFRAGCPVTCILFLPVCRCRLEKSARKRGKAKASNLNANRWPNSTKSQRHGMGRAGRHYAPATAPPKWNWSQNGCYRTTQINSWYSVSSPNLQDCRGSEFWGPLCPQ